MIETFLNQPFPGCSPEAKYLAIKIVTLYGEELRRQLRIEDVSIDATLSRSRTSKLMSELVNHGILSVEERSDGPGRPKKIYDVSMDFKRRSACTAAPSSPLKKAVTTLFETNRHKLNENIKTKTEDSESKTKETKPKFTASTVLLLGFLLTKANSAGAVRNLSATEIHKKTGLNVKRQRAHLRKIKNAGFLLHKVQGTVASNLLGKTSSSYWLNLHHVFFQSVSNWVGPKAKIIKLDHWLLVYRLLSNRDPDTYARKIDRAITYDPASLDNYVKNFSERLLDTIRDRPITDNELSPLQDLDNDNTHHAYLCTCEELAEQLVTSTLPTCPDSITKEQERDLKEHLYRRLIPRKNWGGENSESEHQHELLIELHFHLVQGIACDIHRALTSEIKSKKLNEITVLPIPLKLNGARSVNLIYSERQE